MLSSDGIKDNEMTSKRQQPSADDESSDRLECNYNPASLFGVLRPCLDAKGGEITTHITLFLFISTLHKRLVEALGCCFYPVAFRLIGSRGFN